MDKTIENKFFEAFKWCGVVDNCINWMRHTYNLPPMKPIENNQQDSQPKSEDEKAAKEKWERFYKETLTKKILEDTEAFDDGVIKYVDSPLMDEIEANLNECQTDAQRERYLYSLLKPFGEAPSGCGIARIYIPKAEINQLKEDIKELERYKAHWKTMPENKPLIDVGGRPSGTPKEQIEACNSMINSRKEQIEWALYVNNQFCNLTCVFKDGAKWMQAGTVENCLHGFMSVMVMFANHLDALLLTYGIDLMKLQKESGLYLKSHRLITDVDCYIGSMELAQKYIDALPKEPQQNNDIQVAGKQDLPNELNTEIPQSIATKRGRPSKPFKDCLQDMDKLAVLHSVMNGKTGKDAVLVMKVAVQLGWMTKPTFIAVEDEFGDIGNRSNYNKYINGDKFTKDEIEGMKNILLSY